MYLKNISVVFFKNYEQLQIEFSSKINCFTGLNGVGKTNLLDAIYYLSFTKSFFNSVDSQNIKYSEDFFMLEGFFNKNDFEEKISCAVKRNTKKKLKKNGKDYDKMLDHIGLFPVVMVSPYDSSLILDGSEGRRKFPTMIYPLYRRRRACP